MTGTLSVVESNVNVRSLMRIQLELGHTTRVIRSLKKIVATRAMLVGAGALFFSARGFRSEGAGDLEIDRPMQSSYLSISIDAILQLNQEPLAVCRMHRSLSAPTHHSSLTFGRALLLESSVWRFMPDNNSRPQA